MANIAKKKRKMKRNLIILTIILILVAGYLYISSNAKKALEGYAKSSIIESTVELGSIEVEITGNGAIIPNQRYEVYSMYSGEVKNKYVNEGDEVKKDKTLFSIGGYNINAPAPGTVITTNIEKGDYIVNSNNATVATKPVAVIADMSKVKFDIEVDELDINKIKLGTEARVNADAVLNKEYIGKVSKIASEGKNINGVTTYNVTIEIENYDGLKLGMNVDATLIVDKRENVLLIPMEAINKSSSEAYVYIKDETFDFSKAERMLIAPKSMAEVKGYKKQVVTVGINNKDSIEIISGLNQGDKVYSVSTSKSLTEYMLENAGSRSGGMMIGAGASN